MTEIEDFRVEVSGMNDATSHKIYKIVKYHRSSRFWVGFMRAFSFTRVSGQNCD